MFVDICGGYEELFREDWLQCETCSERFYEHFLTFKGRMLNIYNAACTLRWPKVQYNLRRAGMKFFRGHGVYLSRKHIRTHCASHGKAWHSLGAMMTFMAVRVSKLFICTLDLQGTAEGVTGKIQFEAEM
jgi:hypothetical protein